jgi:hypothetical protein
MKSIGFIDYYLSEWHANNYPSWIEQANKKFGFDYQIRYAYGEKEISPVDQVSGATWCKNHGVEQCSSIEETCEKSDYLLVLSPSNPEKHLPYAEKVLPFGKRTYIDKTFTPDFESAKKIFALGKKYSCPFFSTSALRFASELSSIKDPHSFLSLGGGSNLPEYIIHQLEMAISVFKSQPLSVLYEEGKGKNVFHARFAGEKEATFVYAPVLPFAVFLANGDQQWYTPVTSDYFPKLLEEILLFFENGQTPFDPQETLYCMALREAVLNSVAHPFEWQKVPK